MECKQEEALMSLSQLEQEIQPKDKMVLMKTEKMKKRWCETKKGTSGRHAVPPSGL